MNPMDLMKNLSSLQSKAKEMQEKTRNISVVGSAGGDMVQIELNGHMEVQKVSISPDALELKDASVLSDLILSAFTDATNKIKEKLREELSGLAGGLDIPPGMLSF